MSAIRKLLIANRGEIAVRIARTARDMGIETVAIFSDADAGAPHTRAADRAVRVGPSPSNESYANAEAVLAAAETSGCDALHPGYGFLAENADFAEACASRGITFVGPSPATMRALGDKSTAKRLLAETRVPMLLGYDGTDQSDATLQAAAATLGAPLMIKAAAGGGGRGMRLVTDLAVFPAALASARSEAVASFGSPVVLLERALIAPRHIEVQIFGDRHGSIVHLGERDCSVQRRHQKLIEESPSPFVTAVLRERLVEAALTVAHVAKYENAGTVEFLVDDAGEIYFIEVNARLQVEHPVTEAVTGLDLVEWQLRVARGEALPLAQSEIHFRGHAIEARLCAEDPEHDFLPQAGRLVRWTRPPRLTRVDHALEPGLTISPFYDSMIAKIVSRGATRDAARRELIASLDELVALGVPTNRDSLLEILRNDAFAAGQATTGLLASIGTHPRATDTAEIALAAALLYRTALARADYREFGGWSTTVHPGTTMRLAPRGGGEATSVRVSGTAERVVALCGDTSHAIALETVSLHSGSTARASVDDAPWRSIEFVTSGDGIEFVTGDRTAAYVDRLLARATSSGATAALDGLLRAPMSGKVVRIGALAGETAAADSVLIVLEAMKMEHHLTLPVAATIRSIDAANGRQVSSGEILLAYDLVDPA